MKRTLFNENWTVKPGVQDPFSALFGGAAQGKPVTLPHDAMIEEDRDPNCESGGQAGFYPAKSYTYTKVFTAPETWQGRRTLVEFEGVMQKAMVYLNGEFLMSHAYGYTGFTVDLTSYLRYGQENELKVLALGQEKASRWYSGMGIYRDVYLLQGGSAYISDIKITTETIEEGYAVLRVDGRAVNQSAQPKTVELRLNIEGAAPLSAMLCLALGENSFFQRVTVDSPALWSPETPKMYACKAELYEGEIMLDAETPRFGIRTLQLDARQGLRINGKTVKLRGACIHHDNGVIGCTNIYEAERFRMERLKSAGFNAIRSAHHPAGPSLLKACDDVGILVMDELADMWNEPKNPHDFGLDFAKFWEDAAAEMVAKDYNHPSVVLYSTGNEIPEISKAQGYALHRAITEKIKGLDPTRYTTCGINGFLAVSDALGSMMEQEKQETISASNAGAGSEALNSMMGASQWEQTDKFSESALLTERLEPSVSSVDVAGYNYLTARHIPENLRHPDRVVVGSETFPPEIGRLWPIVRDNPHVIGDFTWTGYDYLGEAGIGIPHYGEVTAQGMFPDRLAYCGDIDLNAARRPVSYLREIAFGLRHEPYIAVHRPEVFGKAFDSNNWKYFDSLHSWTYPGQEGKPTRVYVLADCDEVELTVNGKPLGRKKIGEVLPYTAAYEVDYQPGQLKAVGYRDDKPCGEDLLSTAGAVAAIKVTVYNETVQAGGQGLSFVMADLVDEKGAANLFDGRTVTVKVEGAGSLQGFGSADPSSEGSYQSNTCPAFHGRVMAVIRGGMDAGECRVTFSAEGLQDVSVTLQVTAQ